MSNKKEKRKLKSAAKAKNVRRLQNARRHRAANAISDLSDEMISNPVMLREKAKTLVDMKLNKNEKGSPISVARLETDIPMSLNQYIRFHALVEYFERLIKAGKIEQEDIEPVKQLIAVIDKATINFVEESALITQFIEENRKEGIAVLNDMLQKEPIDNVIAQMYFGTMEAIGTDFPAATEFSEKYAEHINPMFDEGEAAYKADPKHSDYNYLTYIHLERLKLVTPLYRTPEGDIIEQTTEVAENV